jgi:hypothetical protein
MLDGCGGSSVVGRGCVGLTEKKKQKTGKQAPFIVGKGENTGRSPLMRSHGVTRACLRCLS